MTLGRCKHGTFALLQGCSQCIEEKEAQGKVELKIKVTAPPGAPEGEEEKVAGEIVELAEIFAEIQGAPKPEVRIAKAGGKELLPKGGLAEAAQAAGAEVTVAKVNYKMEPADGTDIALRPGEDIEIRGYYNEALSFLKFAKGRVIANIHDAKGATDDLVSIKKLRHAMEARRKEVLAPHKEQIDAINETYKTLMEPVLEADKITRGKMDGWDAEQKRIQAEQEEVNRLRMEAAEKEMKLKGELTESVNLIEVEEAPKKVTSFMGSSGMRDNWKWKVVDEEAIPRAYLIVDNAQLTAIARRHHDKKPIAGIEFYNEKTRVVRG